MKQKSALISLLIVALVFGGVMISGCIGNNNDTNNSSFNASMNSSSSPATTNNSSTNTKTNTKTNTDNNNKNNSTHNNDNLVKETCPVCGGAGGSAVGDHGWKVCSKCGGKGYILVSK